MKVSRTVWTTLQAGVPVVLSGDYGIGKSTVVSKFAGWLVEKGTIQNLVRLPLVGAVAEDLVGYPEIQTIKVGNKSIRVTVNAIHERLVRLLTGPSVLLLEEINRADERLQNSIAQILDGEIGQFGKTNRLIVVGTMNPHGRGIYELNENLISRMAFYECRVDPTEERIAILTGRYNTESNFKPIPDDWKRFEGLARGWLAAFYEHRPSVFKAMDGVDLVEPWPNPRARDKLAVPAVAAALSVGYNTPDDLYDCLAATMGRPFATEFRSWFASRNYPNPRQILDIICRGEMPKFGGGVPAFIAAYSEVLHLLLELPEPERQQKACRVLEYFGRIVNEIPEAVAYITYIYLESIRLPNVPLSLVRLVNQFKGVL